MAASSSDIIFYHYRPSLSAAAVFVAIFGLSTLLHFYQLLRKNTIYMVPLVIGGTCEAIGYVGRVFSHIEAPDYKLPAYILQSLLLLIAPALMAASIYMILGRIVSAVDGESRCPIKRKYLTVTFVLGDFMSFMTQSTGAGLLAQAKQDSKTAGKWIIVGGLAIQLMFFGLFMIVSFRFYRCLRKSPTPLSKSHLIPWRRILYTLYAASIFIVVRSVFRVVEYIQGDNGYLLRREIWLYIFDATLMAVVMLLFNVVHPSMIKAAFTTQEFPLQEHTDARLKISPENDFTQVQADVAGVQTPV